MKISSENIVFTMSKDNEPAAKAQSGDKVTFEALDCFSNTVTSKEDTISKIDFDAVNPATGPLYVEGAEPGDTLKVTIHSIELTRDTAVTIAAPDFGQLGDQIEEEETLICPVNEAEGTVQVGNVTVPMRKMIGVIGTAPGGEAVNTGTPGDHGGNMDTTLITEGATLYLPVEVDGALLAMGDCHAGMGDGEISGAGLEIPADITVIIEVLKDAEYPLPFVEDDDIVAAIASSETTAKATYRALDNLSNYIQSATSLSSNEAIMLLSSIADVKACQIVNPNHTMRAEIPKSVLNSNK